MTPPTHVAGYPHRPEPAASRHRHVAEFVPEADGRLRPLWAGLRLGMGWIFLWAFLDKLLGLGFSTAPERAWLAGGSPTRGFLTGSTGPLADFYHGIAGAPPVDALFMLGLLGVGLAFLLGIGTRVGAVAGSLMLVLMWTAAPPRTNPFLDYHFVYAALMLGLAAMHAGRWWGLGAWWEDLPLVRRFRWLA